MKIRFVCAILLIAINFLSIVTGATFAIEEVNESEVSCSSFQASSSDDHSAANCSKDCKNAFSCLDCGPSCFLQSILISSDQVFHLFIPTTQFLVALKAPLVPDLGRIKKPPRFI